jgi:integrase/recombinase XerD
MKLTKIYHKGEERIKVEFPYNQGISTIIKQINDAKWSKTQRSWHLPYTKESYTRLLNLFPSLTFETDKSSKPEKEKKSSQEISSHAIPVLQNGVSVEVLDKKIILKLPKNELDTHFIVGLRFSKWDKVGRFWQVPNYGKNLHLIQEYFGTRISNILYHKKIELEEQIEPLIHLKNEVLAIEQLNGRLKVIFSYRADLVQFMKEFAFANFDAKNKYWTIPFTDQYLNILKNKCQLLELKLAFSKEKVDSNTIIPRKSATSTLNYRNCPKTMLDKLTELRYSPQTIKTYTSLFEELINHFPTLDIDKIDETKIVEFCRYLVTDRKVSASYQNQAINAIKFYYERVLGGQRKFYFLERPLKEKTLPLVLSEMEVQNILNVTENLKHKTILALIYSAGLRVSEAINLKISDIDAERKQLRVVQSKGKKDRYTLLSEKALVLMRTYYKEYKPKVYLFEGQNQEQYSVKSIQLIFRASCTKAKIGKKATVHTLRHSFATHLLENGTDLRYIQSLLGHESSKTTEIYTHITTKGMEQIKSPIDKLDF